MEAQLEGTFHPSARRGLQQKEAERIKMEIDSLTAQINHAKNRETRTKELKDFQKTFWEQYEGIIDFASTAADKNQKKVARQMTEDEKFFASLIKPITARDIYEGTPGVLAGLSAFGHIPGEMVDHTRQVIANMQAQFAGYRSLPESGPITEIDRSVLEWAAGDAVQAARELQERINEELSLSGQPSILERVFGSEDDAEHVRYMTDVAVGALTQIKEASADAWVAAIADGQSWAASMNAAVGNVLRGLAKEFFVRSLGAFAGGNLASGAGYLAASTAAALAAREFGASSAGSARPSSTGQNWSPYQPGDESNKGDGERNITIILGSGFYDETPREQRARMARAVRAGMRETGSNAIKHM
jgi:hypothetical protein